MPDRFEDDRGLIQDLLGQIDAVTYIHTVKGAIRGNHVHKKTTQWTWVLTGRLLIKTQEPGEPPQVRIYVPGEMACEMPGIPHAWCALSDCEVLVFTKGPRAGEDYESDTERLAEPLL